MKIGLVLSGGGARGAAHLGVLKFLEEKNIQVDYLSGTSAGAIAGAFFAAGYEAGRIAELLKKVNFFSLMRPAFSSAGFFKTEKINSIYSKYLPQTFEELRIPLWISAIDVERGCIHYFQTGELYKPIIASGCLPMFFEPISIGKGLYMDGGVLNNLPVEPLVDKCDKIIGVHVNPTDTHFRPRSMTRITQRCIELAVSCNVEQRRNYCDLFIEPPELKNFTMYNLSRIDDFIGFGYTAIEKQWDTLDLS